ncbi:MAG: metal ABC transporter solute-binding protein, Zn/Mn family [Phycisphaerae bacterium]
MLRLVSIIIALTFVTACSPTAPPPAAPPADTSAKATVSAERPSVFVSLIPQKFFVDRVAGGLVDVHVLIGAGQSEHVFEPTSRQMTDLAESKLYFAIGSSPEKAMLAKMLPNMKRVRLVNTRDGVKTRVMGHSETCTAHDHDHDHDHGGEPDPHIWLDPTLVKTQAATVARALSELLPQHKAAFDANLAKFHAELDALDEHLAAALAPLRGQTLFAYHPSFGYFADRYGLKQVAIEVSGREPSPKEAATIIERAKKDNVRLIITQPQFPTSAAEVIAKEIGGAVLSIDPLAPDYIENLERMAAAVSKAFQGSAGG